MTEFMMAHPYLTTLIAIVACACAAWVAMFVLVIVFIDCDIRRQMKERRLKKYDEVIDKIQQTQQPMTPDRVRTLLLEFDEMARSLGVNATVVELDEETGLEVEMPLTDYLLRESAKKQGENP